MLIFANMLHQQFRYFREKKFEITAVEKTIVNHEQGYGGTADAVGLTSCGKKFIFDWKSRKFNGKESKAIYRAGRTMFSVYGA